MTQVLKNHSYSITILIVGIFLRVYLWQAYPFGFDQVQIVEVADKIIAGDFTLIGPKSGPIQFFTGPLVFYLMALVKMLFNSPIAVMISALIVSLSTGLFLCWINKNYFQNKHFWIPLIWAVSPLLVQFDRGFWNPNLTLLASSLVFFPVLKAISKSQTPGLLAMILLGSWLGYQAHFSGLLFPLIVLVMVGYYAFKRKGLGSFKMKKLVIFSAIGTFLSLLPTLIFDIRNDWLNLKGLTSLVGGDSGRFNLFDLLNRFGISVELFGKVMTGQYFFTLSLVTGLVGIFIIYELIKKTNSDVDKFNVKFSLTWMAIIALAFSFYHGQMPEYYYFIQLPAALMLWSSLLNNHLHSDFAKGVFILFLAAYSFSKWKLNLGTDNLQLGNQYQVAQAAELLTNQNSISRIDFEYPETDIIGVKYWLSQMNIALDEGSDQRVVISPSVTYDSISVGEVQVGITNVEN